MSRVVCLCECEHAFFSGRRMFNLKFTNKTHRVEHSWHRTFAELDAHSSPVKLRATRDVSVTSPLLGGAVFCRLFSFYKMYKRLKKYVYKMLADSWTTCCTYGVVGYFFFAQQLGGKSWVGDLFSWGDGCLVRISLQYFLPRKYTQHIP